MISLQMDIYRCRCISMCLYIATSIELQPSSASGCAKGGSRNQTSVCHPHNSRRSKSSFNIGSKGFVKSQNTPQNSEACKTAKAKNMFNKNRRTHIPCKLRDDFFSFQRSIHQSHPCFPRQDTRPASVLVL